MMLVKTNHFDGLKRHDSFCQSLSLVWGHTRPSLLGWGGRGRSLGSIISHLVTWELVRNTGHEDHTSRPTVRRNILTPSPRGSCTQQLPRAQSGTSFLPSSPPLVISSGLGVLTPSVGDGLPADVTVSSRPGGLFTDRF